MVARALLKDAPVMLFDEASSGFDVEANEYLYKIITEEMPEKSVIFIHIIMINWKNLIKYIW